MALTGGQVGFTGYQRPDYSGVVEASGLPLQTIIKGVEDYKQAKEQRKKLDAGISASRTGIESAIKMGEAYGIDVKSALQPVLDKMNDPNTTPYEAAMLGQGAGEQIANVLNIGTKVLAERESQKTAQLKALADMEASRNKPPEVKRFGVKGGEQDFEWNKDTKTWVPIQAGGSKISAPTTYYSFGKDANGPDEAQDKWTNQGYTSTGQNLTEGIAAVNPEKIPLGTMLRDAASGKVYIAADSHGNQDPNVIDVFTKPEEYVRKKEDRTYEIIGSIPKEQIPKTPSGIASLIEQYSGMQPSAQGEQIGFKPDKPEEKTIIMTADEAKAAGYKVSEPGSYQVKTKGGRLVGINRIGSTSAVESPEQKLSGQRLLDLDKKQSEIRDFGNIASTEIAQLEKINNLLDTTVKTGFGRQAISDVKRVLGQDISDVEQFQSLVGNEAMKNIALTKGAISDREMDYFKNVLSPNMGKTTEGNKKIIDFKIRHAERSKKIARKISEMQKAGKSPFEIQDAINNIVDTESLMDVDSQPARGVGSASEAADATRETIQNIQNQIDSALKTGNQ